MADYALIGKKGTGKSKNGVRIAFKRYLSSGRMLATNLDLQLEPFFGPYSRLTYVRVPDKPTAFDLEAVGHGNPKDPYNEDRAGMMLLDEMGTWMNTRTYADKERLGVLDWLAHARKYGFDCWYVMQGLGQIDKQARESFVEFVTRHTRFDKMQWPLVGGLLALLFGEKAAYMPRFHVAVTRMGVDPVGMVAGRASFKGDDIEPCYDTLQVFRADYPHGTHSVLSPWHVKGRFLKPQPKGFFVALLRALVGARGKVVPDPVRPLTAPDAAWARVRLLASRLPKEEGLRVMARYAAQRATQAATTTR
jgi:hypothetical protein